MTYVVIIELYVVLSIVNAFLAVGQGIYQDENPGENFRSPFDTSPLPDTFEELDTDTLNTELTNPTNSTGDPIAWVSDALQNFEATIDQLLYFVQFFTAGFLVDMLNGIGFPGDFLYIITVPAGIYTGYMILVLITNRLGN